MDKETHIVRVALESGVVLTTRETLASQEEADELIESIYEDRSTTWKDVGDIRFRFRDLAALQVEEL